LSLGKIWQLLGATQASSKSPTSV